MACKEQFENVNDGLLVRAPAKINLSLLIAGKRRDGFHDIETVMAKINWYDQIFIEKGTKTGIDLVCKGSYSVPAGEENLVFKTCKLLLDTCDLKANIKITLTKNIPAGSGLGSASSDAAATLMGVNRFLGPGLNWVFPYPIDEIIRIPVKKKIDLAINSLWYYQSPSEMLPDAIKDRNRIKPVLDPIRDGYCITRSEKQGSGIDDLTGSAYKIEHSKWQLT